MSQVGNAEAQAPAEGTVAETTNAEAGKEAGAEKPEGEKPEGEDSDGDTEAQEGDGAATGTEGETEDDGNGGKRPTKSALRREKQKQRETALVEENRRLAERLEMLERNKPGESTLGPKPDRSKYDDEAEYTADLAAYKVREAAQAERTKTYETDTTAAKADAAAARMTLFKERAMALTDQYPDIEAKVFNDPTLPMSATMAETIMASEMGPQIAYHLSANRELAQRIKSMTPLAAAMELGRIEAKLSLPKPRTETKAPPPPKTLNGSVSGPAKKLEDMGHAEFRAWRKSQGLE